MSRSVYVIVLCGCMAAQHSGWAADGKSRTTSGPTNQAFKARTTSATSQPRVMTPGVQTTTTPVRTNTFGSVQTTTRTGTTTGGNGRTTSLSGPTTAQTPATQNTGDTKKEMRFTPTTSLAERARIDKKDIKQNIVDAGTKQQFTDMGKKNADAHNPFFGLQDGKGGGQPGGGIWVGGGSDPTKEGGKGDVFRGLRSDVPAIPGGAKYNDTFGGERLNNRRGAGGMDPGNFIGGGDNAGGGTGSGGGMGGGGSGSGGSGSGAGTSGGLGAGGGGSGHRDGSSGGGSGGGGGGGDSGFGAGAGGGGPGSGNDGMGGQSGLDKETTELMLRAEGGTPTGNLNNDRNELGYAQRVGTDGYAATKNMNEKEREAYWAAKEKEQRSKPREDADGGGSGTPITRQGLNTLNRGISGRVGGADGKDGRVENSMGSGGRVNLPMGKDDKPAKEAGGGKINWDKVLEINQKVNPGSQ